jgi:hypothetical protein
MPATIHSLFAVSLEPSASEACRPDLTEFRIVVRPFPKTTQERKCYQYLLAQMQAMPNCPQHTKAEFEKTCRARFRVTVDSFNYCWREAIKVSGADWDQPGRRSR